MSNKLIFGIAFALILMLMLIIVPVALGLAGLANQGGGGNTCDAPATGEVKNVFAVGDSIMRGLADPALSGGAPLRKELEAKGSFEAAWFPGKDTRVGVDGVRDNKERVRDADAIIVELGTNKSYHGAGSFKDDAELMVKTLHDLNKKGEQAQIYWVKLFSGGIVDDYREQYNKVIEGLAGVTPIETKVHGYGSQSDSVKIHPTGEGYADLAKTIADGLGGGTDASDCASGDGAYINPIGKDQSKWQPLRTDQGVDWGPVGEQPVKAIGRAKITYSSTASGWPGGAFLVYKLLDGDHKGAYIYVSEHLRDLKPVDTEVQAGDTIAIAMPGRPWTEWGWANPPGVTDLARAYTCYDEGEKTASGHSFARFLIKLGVTKTQDEPPEGGTDQPEGPLC